MNKYEKLIEYIINDEEAKAKELFHEIVVEKSRDIYESIMDEEMIDEVDEKNAVDDLVDDISDEVQKDETMEADDEADMDADMIDGNDEIGGDDAEMGGDDQGPATKSDVMDLSTQLDALTAKFDELLSGEQEEPEHDDMDNMDMGADMEMPGDRPEESMSFESVNEAEDEEDEDEEDDKEDKKDSKMESRKSESELMREYVEKISAVVNTEGNEVGSGGTVPVNKTSVGLSKDPGFGGTAGNIAKGGSEQSPDGTSPKKANNPYTKGQGEHPVAKKNMNVPGGKAGTFFSGKAKAKTGEEGGVNKSSIEPGK
jgi:hypothetical protein